MEEAKLKNFLRDNLDILFIGLNPALGSNQKGHYFSVNQSFWSQLYKSGLILKEVDKNNADDLIFGDTALNIDHLNFGITDLVPNIANSNSKNVKPTPKDCVDLVEERILSKKPPRTAIIYTAKY